MGHLGRSYTGSKVILLGEHFVVYKAPAIALPFMVTGVEVEVTKSSEDIIVSQIYNGLLHEANEQFKGLKNLIIKTKTQLHISEGLQIKIDSKIPLQRGMGSSAAISVGIVKAIYNYLGLEVDHDFLREVVYEAEHVHHETASGIDIETIMSHSPIKFIREQGAETINTHMHAQLILVDSGIMGATSQAVSQVGVKFKNDPEFKKIILEEYMKVFKQGVSALQNEDAVALGEVMNHNHKLLQRIDVSHPVIDQYIEEAISMGALGAKITGGGLGGCFLILSNHLPTTIKLKEYYINEGLNVSILEMRGLNNDKDSTSTY